MKIMELINFSTVSVEIATFVYPPRSGKIAVFKIVLKVHFQAV